MQPDKRYRITGEVEEIVYRNEQNGYTVLELNTDSDIVTAVGIMPYVGVGEELILTGTLKNHHAYGEQFSVECCERKPPATTAAILKYLSSGAIKGVRAATANALVDAFGENTLDVLKTDPKRVATVKGISYSKAKEISEQLNEIFGLREVLAFLEGYGIMPADCVKVWKILGNDCIELIKENPYIMCTGGLEIPFEKADRIADENELLKTSEYRIRAGIIHILQHNKNNGHTCLPCERLAETASSFLNVDPELTEAALNEMITDTSLKSCTIGEREFAFLPFLYDAEVYAAARMQMLLRFPSKAIFGISDEITEIEINDNIRYADLQKQAITQALNTGLLILTGGPGTGKTTTLNAIIKILKKNGEKVFLAAPTGRAAQRMSQLTGCEAKTIHRMLEVCWNDEDQPTFKKNEKNQLSCDALILDELSMIDSQLFECVMRALPMGCRLIMVGDTDQLPSVGAGNVLGDLIASNIIPVVQLKEIFRQSMQSLIVTNAHKIVSGISPDLDVKDSDFFFLNCNNTAQISTTIMGLCKTRLPKTYGYSPLNDIQVLAPGKKGELGTIELNKRLQEVLNPAGESKKETAIMGKIFREGDKVIQMRNNYNIEWVRNDGESGEGIFNGDVGILTNVNKLAGTMTVCFDDKTAVYAGDDISDLDLAYALTVHKSQGNEFEAVIIPMYRGAPQLCYRNLLYTAVTRAKKLLIMVGTPSTVESMVNNNRRMLRYSGLKEFLLR